MGRNLSNYYQEFIMTFMKATNYSLMKGLNKQIFILKTSH